MPRVLPEGSAGLRTGSGQWGVTAAARRVLGPEWSHCHQLFLQPNAIRVSTAPSRSSRQLPRQTALEQPGKLLGKSDRVSRPVGSLGAAAHRAHPVPGSVQRAPCPASSH